MVPTHRRLLPVPCGAAEILLHTETVRVHHADSEVGDFISAGNGTVVPSKGGIDIGLSACPSLITPARKRLGPRVVLLGGDQKSAERALGITHTAGSAQIKLSQTTLCIRMPGFGGRRIPQHRAAAIDIQRRFPTITFAEINCASTTPALARSNSSSAAMPSGSRVSSGGGLDDRSTAVAVGEDGEVIVE